MGRVILAAALGAGVAMSGCSRASDVYEPKRLEMVERQIAARGVKDPRVLEAMRTLPRHLFVPDAEMAHAYEDRPLPIGSGQTISQPYIVAFMTEQLHLTGSETVLEIGTGSGYQTAVLARLARKVYSIEIRPELAQEAAERLKSLGISNAEVMTGDGYKGWPEHAPFDGILVTAAPERIPPPLLEQLASPGRMVIPVGGFYQELKVIERTSDGFRERSVLPVRFVPFVRETPTPPPAPAH
ncbi:MAG TPA: protein-L-isoaspartate(D-aspartate) O-methyltransferase [Thermoanaerobaculia bacterium]|nr:protein-L-isoaspartate(D-aspartate) O-methyltransferase [Thermoanaerobaculia bacterium]